MRYLPLIIVFALITNSVFPQKDDVKSGTIRVVKKKYNVKHIYPRGINNVFFSGGGTGQSLVVANLYGHHGTYVMSAQELLIQKKLFVNSDEYEVMSFDLSYRVNGVEVVESSDGDRFSENQKILAGYARKGTRLFIENIKCKNPDGIIKNSGTIIINIPSGIVRGRARGPDPFLIASVSGIYGQGILKIRKRELLKAKKIDLADSTSKIVGFTLACDYRGKKPTDNSTSDRFTPKMMDILSKMRSGDSVFFNHIRYSDEDGTILYYGNLKFAVVK